jgi:tryptophan synthase alpha chain
MQTSTLPASKITRAFEQARRDGRGVLIPYFMCGYPSAARSVELALAAAEAGADIVELGMPFSDPLADGATIQHAGHVALERGMAIKGCLEVARQVSAKSNIPLVLMGLSLVFLIPPTTPDERIASIAKLAAAGPGTFIYCVSLAGVTGARSTLPPYLRSFIARVYGYTKGYHLPLAVGFGLSTPEHIAEVTGYADAAVVASALINLIDQCEEGQQVETVKRYIQSLRSAK